MANKAKNLKGYTKEQIREFVNTMREEIKANANFPKVHCSKENRKMTEAVLSVSLPPVVTCANCGGCSKYCYAIKMARLYKNCGTSWAKNYARLLSDEEGYFSDIRNELSTGKFKFFRWHVSGDIVNDSYFANMVAIAKEFSDIKFLAFTKNYKVVNAYMAVNGDVPENLRIVYSAWVGTPMDNPYNMPTSNPMFADGSTTAHEGAKYCPGNCAACASHNMGCWSLAKREEVLFFIH